MTMCEEECFSKMNRYADDSVRVVVFVECRLYNIFYFSQVCVCGWKIYR